jgi:hypothetical protein
MRKLGLLFFLLIGTAGIAAANGLTVNLQFENVGPGFSDGRVYVYPYNFSINSSSTLTPLVCDDLLDDISFGESWTANVNNMADILKGGLGQMRPPGGLQPDAIKAYEDAAWLYQQLILPSHFNNTDAVAINRAIWALFTDSSTSPVDPYTVISTPPNPPTPEEVWFDAAEANTAGLSIDAAITEFSDVQFYTPVAGSWPSNSGRPQEFIGTRVPDVTTQTVPEPSTLLLLGAGVLVLGFLRLK